MPTPPFSPEEQSEQSADGPLKSTLNLLESLVAFYQHERMWVYHTRAILEDAFQTPTSGPQADFDPHLPSPSTPSSALESPIEASGQYKSSMHKTCHTTRLEQSNTPWTRRKRGFKLRLIGINRKPNSMSKHSGRRPQSVVIESREEILEMFEKMMETRMASCQRMSRLVRETNLANSCG